MVAAVGDSRLAPSRIAFRVVFGRPSSPLVRHQAESSLLSQNSILLVIPLASHVSGQQAGDATCPILNVLPSSRPVEYFPCINRQTPFCWFNGQLIKIRPNDNCSGNCVSTSEPIQWDTNILWRCFADPCISVTFVPRPLPLPLRAVRTGRLGPILWFADSS